MKKEIVEKIYVNFDELSEHGQHQEIKKARKDDYLVDWYFEYENEGYQLNIDDLKERYDVDFDIDFFRNSTDIKSLKFKYDDDLLHLNYDKFYDELLDIINSYEFLFKGELDDNFDDWVKNYFIDTDVEFLVSEKVVNNE